MTQRALQIPAAPTGPRNLGWGRRTPATRAADPHRYRRMLEIVLQEGADLAASHAADGAKESWQAGYQRHRRRLVLTRDAGLSLSASSPQSRHDPLTDEDLAAALVELFAE